MHTLRKLTVWTAAALLLSAAGLVTDSDAQNRPQNPQPPFPYGVEDVFFDNQDAGARLAGTLTLPEGEGPFPAAVLVSGSGAQDRDEEVFGHRPFWVLADHLSRRGIAVLRYDDRGSFESTGDFDSATSEDFADDALAAVDFLQSRGEIDPQRVGIIGHSEGGLIAPMAATRSDNVAYIVLLAGTGVDGESILLAQQQLIARALGASEEDIALGQAINRAVFAIVKRESDNQTAADEIIRMIRLYEGLTGAQRRELETAYTAQFSFLLSPWYRFFLTYDPATSLRQVQVPVLAINGTTDLQVPPDNLEAIADALAEAGNPDYTTVELPNLNHFFQNSSTGSPAEYASIEETFAPEALNVVSDWLVARFVEPATAVVESYADTRPRDTALEQNYPNPFNSGTVIRFALAAAGPVRLDIYNALGQPVETLVRGTRAAGTYALHWDGLDQNGTPAASGIYHYRLVDAAGRAQTRQLLLLR